MVKILAKRRRLRRAYRRAYGISRRHPKATVPIAVVMGAGAGLIGPLELVLAGRYYEGLRNAVLNYTGYNVQVQTWTMAPMKNGLVPLAIGILIHKGASMLGVNRALGAAKIPFLRV